MYVREAASRLKDDQPEFKSMATDDKSRDINLWQAHIGQIPEITRWFLSERVTGLKLEITSKHSNDNEEVCGGCSKGRLTVKPFPKKTIQETETKELL